MDRAQIRVEALKASVDDAKTRNGVDARQIVEMARLFEAYISEDYLPEKDPGSPSGGGKDRKAGAPDTQSGPVEKQTTRAKAKRHPH